MKRFLVSLLVLVAFAAGAKDAPTFDPAADSAALASDFVKAEKLKNVANVRRVAISQFRVEFAVENDAKASSSGTTGWTSSSSDIKLTGVTDETRQAIADQLYARLVDDLKATGLEVVPYDTVKEAEAYKSLSSVLKSTQEPVGTQYGKAVFIGPTGMPIYFTNDDHHLGLGTALGNFSTTQPQNIEPRIAEALDAAVLRVTVAVAFADQSKSGGLFHMGSSVKTTAQLALVPEMTGILIITPNDGKAHVYLNETVLIAGDVLDLKETTTSGEKAAQAVSNVITGLLAGGGRSTAHYEATTTPENYSGAVDRYVVALEGAMISALRPGLTSVTPPPAAPAAPPEAVPAAVPAVAPSAAPAEPQTQ